MGQIKLLVSATFIALFTVALITFAINFGLDNNTRINLANNSNFVTLQQNLSTSVNTTFYDEAQVSSEEMGKVTISSTTEAAEGGAGIKVGPATAIGMAYNSMTASFETIFGEEFRIFLWAFISVLGFIAALYIYKTLAGRNPD